MTLAVRAEESGIAIVFLGAPFYAFWRWQLKRHPRELKEFE
jgi:hypothetical protein